jgi:hypothetical protein
LQVSEVFYRLRRVANFLKFLFFGKIFRVTDYAVHIKIMYCGAGHKNGAAPFLFSRQGVPRPFEEAQNKEPRQT